MGHFAVLPILIFVGHLRVGKGEALVTNGVVLVSKHLLEEVDVRYYPSVVERLLVIEVIVHF